MPKGVPSHRTPEERRLANCASMKAYRDRLGEDYRISHRLYMRKYNKRSRDRNRKRKYGLTEEMYHAILESQNHHCAICLCHASTNRHGLLFVDHDHVTGRVRGLLCDSCNVLLGRANDSADRLRKAATYLER